ncbi:Uncharacterised protein [Legionella sainthelensi]|uniref:hypothetical protein n=1 Tax=Legionella sainthelensi TaxID=28087 RepID=UPI000E1FFB55|nr:hypothetical protein [Legionella sainthelensi]VEB35702.1 Uncharacterised protein [Legionella sainthelensi]
MSNVITGEMMVEMLNQLAQGHFYEKTVMGLTDTLASFINANNQLHELLERCAKKSNFQNTRTISWSDLGSDDKKIINCFFDYLYFTSPQFLKDAG